MTRPSPELAPVTTATLMLLMPSLAGTTVTGHRPALTSRTASDPIHRCPACIEAPTMTASARISSATRRSSVYGSPRAITNVSGTPSLLAPSSACRRRSAPVSSSACSCAAIAAAPAPAAAPYMADGRAT